jgi:hypothetical protein
VPRGRHPARKKDYRDVSRKVADVYPVLWSPHYLIQTAIETETHRVEAARSTRTLKEFTPEQIASLEARTGCRVAVPSE